MSSFDLKLDSTQKSKLQKIISEKLSKISAYTDDVLPEYVMVMVQNKKTLSQVTADLNAFLGKDAGPFAEWLWDLLDAFSKGKQLPTDRSQPKEEPPKPEPPKTPKKLASVITAPSISEAEHDSKRNEKSRKERDSRKERERGRGERKFEKEEENISNMEEEEDTNHHKPSVSSVISQEVEKRPPRDNNVSSRLILSAVKQAVDDTKESPQKVPLSPQKVPLSPQKVPLESPKKKQGHFQSHKMEEEEVEDPGVVTIIVEGTKVTKKRGSWETEEPENDEDKSKKAKQVRCQYWPNCKRGDACVYNHPKERCKNFPNCTFGDQCLFIHPTSDVPCKFGAKCTRLDCTFVHPSSNICKHGFACYLFNGDTCTFQHPQEACKFGDKCVKGAACAYSHGTLCKFGSRCDRPGCTFAHSISSKPVRMSQTPCKFGVNCKNKDTCNFVHPDDGSEDVDVTKLSESLPQTPPTNNTTNNEE